MKKKKLIIILSGLLLLIVAVMCGFSFIHMELLTDTVYSELGESLNNKPDAYADGNLTNAVLDFSKVDVQRIGTYEASISNKYKTLGFMVKVVDTTPPSANAKERLTFLTNQEVTARDLVTDIIDKGAVKVTYIDGNENKLFLVGGEKTETIVLTDDSKNQFTVDTSFMVQADSTKPNLIGVEDISAYSNEQINYLKNVTANDDRDGDITDQIKVDTSKVNVSEPGEYEIIYKVIDSSDNETAEKANIVIKEDKAPNLQGLTDKTVYVNASIDYMNGVSAMDERDGDLTSKIIVDTNNVNLSKAGKYQVTYVVTDSSGQKAQESITVNVINKETTSNNTSRPTKSSSLKNKEKDSKESANNNNSSGFQFFDVEPSGQDVNGDVEASGIHVGTWN